MISTIRSTIKPNQEIDEHKTQPMAENTYNELDLVIQDWLICHSGAEVSWSVFINFLLKSEEMVELTVPYYETIELILK